MTDPTPTPTDPLHLADEDVPVSRLALKALALLALAVVLVVGSVVYVLYARGVFEPVQRVVLIADDAEGVAVGQDITFAGFAIGRVARVELGRDGNARLLIDVPRRNAHWLRTSSVFTLERSLVGGTRLRAYSGLLDDPPLPDGAERTVLRGDAAAEIPKLTAAVRELLEQLNALTRADAPLARSLAHVEVATGRLAGPQGAAALITGNEADAARLLETVERSRQLLARADALTRRLDGVIARADRQLLGAREGPDGPEGRDGLVSEVRGTVRELHGLLGQARQSLLRVDAVLVQAEGVAANTREASNDLTALRAQVESSLRQVDGLIQEVNRKWPFARDTEVRLP